MGMSPVWDKQGFCEGKVGVRVTTGLKCSEEQMLLEATIGSPAPLPVSTGRPSQATCSRSRGDSCQRDSVPWVLEPASHVGSRQERLRHINQRESKTRLKGSKGKKKGT